MSLLLSEAKALEREARANLGKVPVLARAMYPEYIKSAEEFCDRLTRLVKEIESIEELFPLVPVTK